MPFDTVMHGASGALSGFTGLTSKAVSPYTASTTTTKLPASGTGGHILVGLGCTSVTKTKGCRVKGSQSRSSNYFHGPGSVQFLNGLIKNFALDFQPLETLTVEADNTNVAEVTQVKLDLTDDVHRWPTDVWNSREIAGGGRLHCVQGSITPAATVTMFSGEAALDTVAQETNGWLVRKATKQYHLLGVVPSLPTTAAGVIHVRGLAGDWQGRFPGVAVPKVGTVTFDAMVQSDGCSLFYEPVPFTGEGLPQLSMFSEAAAAYTFGLLILEH